MVLGSKGTGYPPKVEQFAHEKLPFDPIGKYSIPTTIFQGRAVKFRGTVPQNDGKLVVI